MILSCAGGGSAVEPPPPTVQAVLVDAGAGGTAWILATLGEAICLETGPGGPRCPPSGYVAPGGVAALPLPDVGALPVVLPFAFRKTATDPSPVDGALLDEVIDDCDVAERFDEAAQWLDAVLAEAGRLVAGLETCGDLAEVLYCAWVERIEAAETVGFGLDRAVDELLFGPGLSGRPIPPVARAGCAGFLVALLRAESRLEEIRFASAACDDAVSALGTAIDRTGPRLTAQAKAGLLAVADAYVHAARGALDRARKARAALQEVREAFVREAVEAACRSCATPGTYRRSPLAGAVRETWTREPILPLAQALESAAARTNGSPEGALFLELAGRLRAVPASRVWVVDYVGRAATGTDHVLLADDPDEDDGQTPQVVVLRELARDADRPDPNEADLALLFEAFRRYAERLPGAP